jgi:RNA polymerase sporulation-specific sigma factor
MRNVQQLIEDNINLVYFVINTYYPTFRQDEDIIQCGMLGLCESANTWSEDKGLFSTYASRCISNRIIQEFRSRKKYKGTLSLDYETTDSDGETKRFGDAIVGEEDVNWVDTDTMYNKLTPMEQDIVNLRKIGWNNKAIAEKLNVSEQTIQVKVRKLRKFWRKINED